MIERLKKTDRWLILSLAIVLGVFFIIAIFNNHIFMFLGDILDQQLKMYIQGWERVHNGSLPFWDWTNFLGANYYSSNTFYFIGSPFFWLTMLVPNKEWILPFFLTLNAIKSLLCAYFTFLWIKEVTNDSRASFVASICFTFCAYNLFNYTNNHMLDVILFFPLCLYFSEKFLKKDTILGLILIIGYIGIVNYYFLYIFTPFLFIYVLVRYLVITKKLEIRKLLLKAIKFIGIFIVGLLLCMITLYPSFLALQGNPRSSELILGFNTIGKHNIYRWITAFFTPICHWREDINYYISNSVSEGIGWGGGMQLYTMLLTPYLITLSLFNKKDKSIWSGYVLYIVYFIFSVFPFFYILFNQNYESRWMINIVLINVLMIGQVLKNLNGYTKKSAVYSFVCIAILMISFCLISHFFGFIVYDSVLYILLRNTVISILILGGYTLVFIFLKRKRKLFNISLCVLLFIELSYSFGNFLFNEGWYLNFMNKEEIESYDIYNDDVIGYIKSIDSGFYRIDVESLQFVAINDAKSMNYNSFNTYHSIYNYNQYDYINKRFAEDSKWTFFPQRGKWQLKNLLSSKYWFTHAGEDVYFNTNSNLNYNDYPPYGYEYLNTVGGTDIYQNKYFIPFIYVKDKTLNEEIFLQQSPLDQDRLLNTYLITATSENRDFEFVDHLVQLKRWDTSVDLLNLNDKAGGYLYITMKESVDISKRSYYYFYDNQNNIIKSGIRENEVSYFGVEIPEGAVAFNVDLLENSYEIYYDDLIWYDEWYQELTQETIQAVKWSDNSIEGIMNVTEGRWMATSIPYDEGWRLLIDGVETEYIKSDCGFIGFYLPQGEHYLSFQFAPKGLLEGLIISVITLLFTLLLIFTRNFKIKQNGGN